MLIFRILEKNAPPKVGGHGGFDYIYAMKRSCDDGTLQVLSPSKAFKKDVSQVVMSVPDTSSHSYVSLQQQDWALRAWSETNRYLQLGGKVIFVSLTYSNTYLPKYQYYSQDGVYHKIPCFSKEHITRFFNSYRKFFERLGVTGAKTVKKVVKVQTGFIPYTDSLGRKRIKRTYDSKVVREEINKDRLPIRYMCCSEFGYDNEYVDNYGVKKKGTKRPHYHLLIFLPPEAVQKVEKELHWSKQDYKDNIQSYWPYGMCRWSKPDIGIFVTSDGATTYVTKYCCKQVDFYNNQELKDYLLDNEGRVISERKQKMKDCLPFHHQSKSFGSALVNDFDTDEKCLEGVDFNLPTSVKCGKRKLSRCPEYIIRKKYMQFDKNGQYRYTDIGYQFKEKEYHYRKLRKEENYRQLLDGIDRVDYDKYVSTLSDKELRGKTWREIRNDITGILGKYCESASLLPEYLTLYDMVYNGMYISHDSMYVDIDSFDIDTVRDDAFNIYKARLRVHEDYDVFDENGYVRSLDKRQKIRYKYSTIEFFSEKFADLARISQICRELRFAHSRDVYNTYKTDRDKTSLLTHQIA